MTLIGYHASHEQFAPDELLTFVKAAEAAGFQAAKSSDHFHPWSERQGQSGFAWSWLGAALEATRLRFGCVSSPGYRYHPAVLAQAAATLGVMYPGRFWFALGSGEAINEAITGLPWPEKAERNARLRECVEIVRALFGGETVTHRGRVTAIEAQLYSRPRQPVSLLGAALSPATARFAGEWADGLLTTAGTDIGRVTQVIDAFRDGGGGDKPIILQAALSWAASEEEALDHAMDQWRHGAIGGEVTYDLRRAGDFDKIAKSVQEADVRDALPVSSSLSFHEDWLSRLVELGPAELHLHQVGRNQLEFIEAFGTRVLPRLAERLARAPRGDWQLGGTASRGHTQGAPAYRDGAKPGPSSSEVQVRPAGPEGMRKPPRRQRTATDEVSAESFPASDPPATNRFD
jgi:coenzyme F420-dependent glucose-6-phosphate dehydrogenase